MYANYRRWLKNHVDTRNLSDRRSHEGYIYIIMALFFTVSKWYELVIRRCFYMIFLTYNLILFRKK